MLEVFSFAISGVMILAVTLLAYMERERVRALFGIDPAERETIPEFYLSALAASVRLETKIVSYLVPYSPDADLIEEYQNLLHEEENVIKKLKKIE